MIKIAKNKIFNYYLPLALTVIVLLVTAFAYYTYEKSKVTEAAWYNTAWTYRKPITVDHNKLSTTATSTFSSFPLEISVTDPQLKTTGNGGLVASSTGADILFTDSDGLTKINYERETYASTTGQLVAWVSIPTLTSSADYTIYIYFGNSTGGLADQQNATGVWDSNFSAVYHLPNGTTLTANDSTSNAKNGTLTNGPTATSGQIDGAASLASASSQYITMGNNLNIGATDFTISYWLNAANANQYGPVVAKLDTGAANISYSTGVGSVTSGGAQTSAKTIYIAMYDGVNLTSAHSQFYHTTNNVVDGNWHHIVVTRTSGTIAIYVDGVSAALTADIASTNQINTTNNGPFDIGWDQFAPNKYNGNVDETRVSTSFARSADWIKTEYNNQSSPSTFYAYGSLGTNTNGITSNSIAASAGPAWYNTGWTYRKPIVIDHNKLSTTATSTFSSFPLLVSLTDSQLKATGNGGLQASSTGNDFLFTDKDGTTKLDHEVETYASTTGQLIAWVRIPTLTSSSDYTIYLYTGNSTSGLADQSNKTGVWDSSYQLVTHLPNGTTLTAKDSTTNNFSQTITGAVAVAGQVDGAASFSGSTDSIVTGLTSHNSLRTYELWTYRIGTGGGGIGRMFDKRTGADGQVELLLLAGTGTLYEFSRDFTGGEMTADVPIPSANAWHHIVVTYDSSSGSNVPAFYVDGVAQSVTFAGTSGSALTNTSGYVLGNRTNDNARNWNGYLDEFRVSNSIRSADWIKTEYNNQSSPSTFYAYGALQTNTKGKVSDPSRGAGIGWYNSAWSYRKPIVIDHNKLGTTGNLGVVQSQQITTTGTNSVNLVFNATPLQGDLLVVGVGAQNTGFTPPSGWTLIDSLNSGSNLMKMETYYHLVGASETNSYNFQTGAAGGGMSVVGYEVKNQAGSPIDQHSIVASGLNPSSLATTNLTPGFLGDLALTFGGLSHFTITGVSAGWTADQNAVPGDDSSLVTGSSKNALTTDTVTAISNTFSFSGSPTYSAVAAAILIKPALDNFPLLVSVTDPQLKSTGNGGLQASSTGSDILFTDSDGLTKLDHEVETYASTTGQLVAWVRIPNLTVSSDYTIYLYFGNASAADQSNKTGVWDSNYKMVQHLPNGTTLTETDSTSSGNNGTASGTPTAITGQIDGAASLNGTSNSIEVDGVATSLQSGDFSISAWIKLTSAYTAASPPALILRNGDPPSNNDVNFGLGARDTGIGTADGKLHLDFYNGSGFSDTGGSTTSWNAGTWYYVSGTYSAINGVKVYINGAQDGSSTSTGRGTTPFSTHTSLGGAPAGNTIFNFFPGSLDDVKVSNVVRSASWIKTEYNNQNSPSTFYAYGALGKLSRQNSSGTPMPTYKVRGGVRFH